MPMADATARRRRATTRRDERGERTVHRGRKLEV
jgi:hypothetical protein